MSQYEKVLNSFEDYKEYLYSISEKVEQEKNLEKIIIWAKENNIDEEKIPRDIQQLKQLEELNLRYKYITKLPREIVGLTNLKILVLGGSLLNTLPSNLGKLSSLTQLILWQNQLSELPLSYANLTNLRILNLDNNNFSIFPECIKGMEKLESLSIGCGTVCRGNNKISHIPDWIGTLSNLNSLNLSGLGLKELNSNICKLNKLLYLGLYRNKLKELPSCIGNLHKLEYLLLNANQLKTLPVSLKSLNNLKTFSMLANFGLIIPKKSLKKMPILIQKEYESFITPDILRKTIGLLSEVDKLWKK